MSFALRQVYHNTHTKRALLGTAWRLENRKRLFMEIIVNFLSCQSRDSDRQPLHLLDVGGRDGILIRKMNIPCAVTAIDIDADALLKYKLDSPTSTVQIADCNENLPFASESFDIIFAGEIIEHLISPELFLSEIRRVLKPKGLFIGSTPNAFRYDKRVLLLLGNDPKNFSDPTHTHYFSYESIQKVLKRHFSSVELECHSRNRLIKLSSRIFSDGFIWQAKK